MADAWEQAHNESWRSRRRTGDPDKDGYSERRGNTQRHQSAGNSSTTGTWETTHGPDQRLTINRPDHGLYPFRILKTSPVAALLAAGANTASFSASGPESEPRPLTGRLPDARFGRRTGKEAAEWIASLKLNDPAREARLKEVYHHASPRPSATGTTNIPTRLFLPASILPPAAAQRSRPAGYRRLRNTRKVYHENLMTGLRQELNENSRWRRSLMSTRLVKGFHHGGVLEAIVAGLDEGRKKQNLGFLKQAREETIDYKNMKEIVRHLEIYKTQSKQYLNAKDGIGGAVQSVRERSQGQESPPPRRQWNRRLDSRFSLLSGLVWCRLDKHCNRNRFGKKQVSFRACGCFSGPRFFL